ncbi:MAG: hypothetical protein JW797_12545, partial [Bradymonadales bacterium]|nr:hypothetical protein [Bradymonadales bacterium]
MRSPKATFLTALAMATTLVLYSLSVAAQTSQPEIDQPPEGVAHQAEALGTGAPEASPAVLEQTEPPQEPAVEPEVPEIPVPGLQPEGEIPPPEAEAAG